MNYLNSDAVTSLFAERSHGIHGSPIDSKIGLLQAQRHRVISFAMGCPGADSIPGEAIQRIAAEVLAADPGAALNYGPTEGEAALREALLRFIPEALEQSVAADELLVTSGGMQGLDLVCKLFINPGDLVVVEEPLYPNTSAVISSYQGVLLPVPIDHNGMRVELIPDLVRKTGKVPKIINVIPNFQNPSGATLSLERRRLLLELADRYGCVILEDDPYGLLYFSQKCPPSIRALSNNSPTVIAVNTFAKILSPGLRVGWVAAAPAVIRKMIDARQCMDTCTNVLGQRIVASFHQSGELLQHIAGLRQRYAAKLMAMSSALAEAFRSTPGVSWNAPQGGFFLWLTLPAQISADELFPAALQHGVAFVPGAAFSNTGACSNAIRVCFAFPPPDEIIEGVYFLKHVVDQFLAKVKVK